MQFPHEYFTIKSVLSFELFSVIQSTRKKYTDCISTSRKCESPNISLFFTAAWSINHEVTATSYTDKNSLRLPFYTDCTINVRPRESSMFPSLDTVTGEPPLDDFCRRWYTEQLEAMGERPLSEETKETYRFTWLRTNHQPIAIRVTDSDTHAVLRAKRASGMGGYEPRNLIDDLSVAISLAQWNHILETISRIGFWSPREHKDPDGLDGASWILEGVRATEYRLWDLWCPGLDRYNHEFRDLCLYFVSLAPIDVPGDEVY